MRWKQILWALIPKTRLGSLTLVTAVVSTLNVLNGGFELGLHPALNGLIMWWDKCVKAVFHWTLDPLVQGLMSLFGFELKLGEHWRHVFLLMSAYFLRGGIVENQAGHTTYAVVSSAVGVVFAFLCALVVGTYSLTSKEPIVIFQVCLVPILGMFFYDVLDTIWSSEYERDREAKLYGRPLETSRTYIAREIQYDLRRLVVGALLAAACLFFPFVRELQSPALAIWIMLFIALATECLVVGWWLIAESPKDPEAKAVDFTVETNIALGLDLIRWVFCVALLVVTNAGL